jgi:hypothetical protein
MGMTEAPRASGLCEAERLLPEDRRRRALRPLFVARLFLLAAAAFLPAACAATSTSGTVESVGLASAEAAPAPASSIVAAPSPSRTETAENRRAAEAVPMLAAAATMPAIFAPDLNRLHGLSADDLRTMLGRPDFRRRDAAAEIWQYRGSDCILDLFLYRETGGYRVSYAETRDADPLRTAPTGCLSTLVASRRSLHASTALY